VSIFCVFLRRPRSNDDSRDDPFWEFGSFGITGCHSKNLLHPKHTPLRDGDRLAFLQGGDGELKIVGLTPAIRVFGSQSHVEARWKLEYRPIPYAEAPLLIDNSGKTNVPSLVAGLRFAFVERKTPCAKAASRLRSRTRPLPPDLCEEVVAWSEAGELSRIVSYADAIQIESGSWHKNAVTKGWTAPSSRGRRYRSLVRERRGGTMRCAPGRATAKREGSC
jgi:hypothetical protein